MDLIGWFLGRTTMGRWAARIVVLLFVVAFTAPVATAPFDRELARAHPEWLVPAAIIIGVACAALIAWRLWTYKHWVALVAAPIGYLAGYYAGGDALAGAAFAAILALWPLAVLWYFLSRSGSFRGWRGEREVQRKLRRLVREDPSGRVLFNEVVLRDLLHSTEIDHILLSRSGIFVIETKSSKHLYVDDQGHWYCGRTATGTAMHSPLEQNRGHIAALRHALGNERFIPIVVFAGLRISGAVPPGVVSAYALRRFLRARLADPVYDAERVKELAAKLRASSLIGAKAHREHVKWVKGQRKFFGTP